MDQLANVNSEEALDSGESGDRGLAQHAAAWIRVSATPGYGEAVESWMQ